MTSIQFNQFNLLVKALDKNNNQVMDELQVSDELKAKVDSDGNGEISRTELQNALQADAVDIRQGQIVAGRPKAIQIPGLETLRNVHTSSRNALSNPTVIAATATNVVQGVGAVVELFSEDKRTYAQRKADHEREAKQRCLAYSAAILTMRSSLQSVADMTRNLPDARSRTVSQQAESALKSSIAYATGGTAIGLLFGSWEAGATGLGLSYASLKGTLQNIEKQTDGLPDLSGELTKTNQNVTAALSELKSAEQQTNKSGETRKALLAAAQENDGKVTGRAGTYSAIGAGVGAVAGAVAGYYNGNSLKGALIGAGVGTAASAGVGALIGYGVDQHYVGKAEVLREKSALIGSYQPEQAEARLLKETETLYQQWLAATDSQNIDQAIGVAKQVQGTQQRLQNIQGEASKVKAAYQTVQK